MTERLSTGACRIGDQLRIALATEQDRATIYRLRHLVYALELHQHAANERGQLTDALDAYNHYVVATLGDELVGFISVTPPGHSYSIDKYLARQELPFACDEDLYEVRLLTVLPAYRQSARGAELAGLLIYAAFRWIEAHGGRRIVAIGRREVRGLYRKVGLQPLGRQIQAGAVHFELMSATLDELRQRLPHYRPLLQYVEPQVDWRLGIPYHPARSCFHGGAFFQAIGDEFDHLDRSRSVINADVLDAWFPPAPAVVAALHEHLPWFLRTSPPTEGAGLIRTIARVRGLDPASVLLGAGSSDLIFRAFRHWLTPAARVLLLDPTYGEYAHVCEQVIACRVERLPLARETHYQIDPGRLKECLARGGYDLAVLVNPNNPTGQHLPREQLEGVLRRVPARTRVWVDEAYIDYVGADQSLEQFAAGSPNVVVCKSLSKGYALSGLRVGYLSGSPSLVEELRAITPPWVVSLPAQVAAVRALQAPDYYAQCYKATHALCGQLAEGLLALNRRLQVFPGVANFLLCHLAAEGPDAATVVSRCRAHGLFLRDVSGMGSALGKHAIRIAVKDQALQQRMLQILAEIGCLGG
jgi:histidinol-phosphate/aromatic aminotransferase/cobyric acid decarboxylase-like protein